MGRPVSQKPGGSSSIFQALAESLCLVPRPQSSRAPVQGCIPAGRRCSGSVEQMIEQPLGIPQQREGLSAEGRGRGGVGQGPGPGHWEGAGVQPEPRPDRAFPPASSCPSGTTWTARATTC